MPSSPQSVRPVLAALLTALLMASSVLVSGSATLLAGAPAAAATTGADVPAAPVEPAADHPVSVDLVSLTPTSLTPGGDLEAELEVTNTSSEPLPALSMDLRTLTSRVTDRSTMDAWQADSAPDTDGSALASSAEVAQLAPGASTTLDVQVSAETLGYSEEPYYWGTRRISLTVVADGQPLTTLRTFVVWRPDDADDSIRQSVLLPLAAADPSAAVTDPEGYARSVESGQLASVRALSGRDDVDWWLDPALLDPPRTATPLPTEGPDAAAEEDAAEPVREFAPEPASAELATALDGAVGSRTVLAMPYAQADQVSLRQAGTERLAGEVRDRGDQVWADSAITPRASALAIAGPQAGEAALESAIDARATAAILPASSLQADPSAEVTPSSVGVYQSTRTEGTLLPVLAPDPELSAEFSQLTAGSDAELTRQRLLAETATIASEYTSAPRHLLISPSTDATLDPTATAATLDAFAEAPWIETESTSSLLYAADHQDWTTDPRSEGDQLYALGSVGPDDVHPSAPGPNGRWEHVETAGTPELLDPGALHELQAAWEQVDTLASVMEDDAPLDAARLEILAGTSVRWRGDPEIPTQRAREATDLTTELQDRIDVIPASGYNVISDAVNVPITLRNDLDTPITVRIDVTSDKPLVQVGEPKLVTVPARGQIGAAVEVEAVANGTVTLSTVVATEDGRPLTEPVEVPLTVNPSWENWTTMVLVIAMGLLVVVGVARARRTGAATRAPGTRIPEDPEVLASTGRSAIDDHAARRAWERPDPPGDDDADPRPSSPPSPDPEISQEDRP